MIIWKSARLPRHPAVLDRFWRPSRQDLRRRVWEWVSRDAIFPTQYAGWQEDIKPIRCSGVRLKKPICEVWDEQGDLSQIRLNKAAPCEIAVRNNNTHT